MGNVDIPDPVVNPTVNPVTPIETGFTVVLAIPASLPHENLPSILFVGAVDVRPA